MRTARCAQVRGHVQGRIRVSLEHKAAESGVISYEYMVLDLLYLRSRAVQSSPFNFACFSHYRTGHRKDHKELHEKTEKQTRKKEKGKRKKKRENTGRESERIPIRVSLAVPQRRMRGHGGVVGEQCKCAQEDGEDKYDDAAS